MSYLVQARLDDHTLSATITTAKEAFAKAIEWKSTGRLMNVTITDGDTIYSIDEFASAMALSEIAQTTAAARNNK